MVSLNTEMELNKIYHMDNREGLKQLPEKCANLIISDPPYFEVKGEFDFVWKDFDEYLRFMEEQAVLYKRILADNGTLFVWGYSKHIAYIQVIFDKYFNLENSLVWRKVDSMQYQYYSVELARRFNTHNERLLMYSIEDTDAAMEKFRYRNPFSIYLKSEFKKLGITNRDVSKLFPSKTGGLTGCVSNWLNGENVITKEQYDVIRMNYNSQILRKDYWLLRGEYDRLYQEFEAYRRPFQQRGKTRGSIRVFAGIPYIKRLRTRNKKA